MTHTPTVIKTSRFPYTLSQNCPDSLFFLFVVAIKHTFFPSGEKSGIFFISTLLPSLFFFFSMQWGEIVIIVATGEKHIRQEKKTDGGGGGKDWVERGGERIKKSWRERKYGKMRNKSLSSPPPRFHRLQGIFLATEAKTPSSLPRQNCLPMQIFIARGEKRRHSRNSNLQYHSRFTYRYMPKIFFCSDKTTRRDF